LRAALAAPKLCIDLLNRRIVAGEVAVELPPAELELLAVFARRTLQRMPALVAPPQTRALPRSRQLPNRRRRYPTAPVWFDTEPGLGKLRGWCGVQGGSK